MNIKGKSSSAVIQSDTSKTHVISSLLWKFLERAGTQGVQFVIQIVLARILCPEDYGILAILMAFIALANVFVQSGFNTSLIQKKDADDLDFSSVFYFNIVMCTVLYLIMFFASPFIAAFYKIPELTAVVRVLSLILVISGVKNVQQAYVSRHLMFKRFFFATLGGTIGAAVIGILMAYWGFGVCALVAQMLFNATIDTLILWITVKWRPKKMFSIKRLTAISFSFSFKLILFKLISPLVLK